MKNIFLKTLFVGCGVFALTACNDYLDPESPSLTDESKVFENPASTSLAVNGLYADLCGENYTQLMTIHQGAGTDVELIDGIGATATSANERGAMNYNIRPGDWAKLGSLWELQYKTILDCNRVVDGIKKSTIFTEGSASEKSLMGRYMSEAMTIRAMVYLDLIRVFGDVPYMAEATKEDLSNANVGKTDRDIIMDVLIEDLEWVVDNAYLPWADQITSEHVNMGYAEALLANICMTRAGYAIREKAKEGYVTADYSDNVYPTQRPSDEECLALYTKAAEHLKAVIDKGIHQMNPSFENEWEKLNKLELDQTYYENMFEIPMGFGNAGELGYTVGVRLNDSNKKLNNIIDYGFTNSSGKLKTTAVQLYSYAAHDQRRDITCVNYEIKDIDRSATTLDGSGTWTTAESMLSNKPFGLYIGKWDVRKMSDQWRNQNLTATNKFGYGINPVRMRYPQVLLWYAECLNEINGGPTAEAKQMLKAVHHRAYFGDESNSELTAFDAFVDSKTSKEDFLDAICEENKLEFCGEGFRKWDLIRWNKLHQAIWTAKKNYIKWRANGYFQEKLYYKYTDDTEKRFDNASFLWYGTERTWPGTMSTQSMRKGTAPTNEWLDSYGYRSTKGSLYPGLGVDMKGLNACSYNKGAFGQEPSSLSIDLPSICGGLVGTQMPTANATCNDEGVTVKNRYLMPIYTNVINSSNGRLSNSYGF